jgi:cytochrome c-type biogenesis protein
MLVSYGISGTFLLLAYSLSSVRALTKYSLLVERIGGGVMVVTGALLATGYMSVISRWFIDVTGFQGF